MAAMNGKLGDKAPQPINIRTVALAARVSMATVSRAINGVATVDPELAKRVWQVIDELGYVPNTQARALVSGRSRILGLIVSEITNPFFPELIKGFEDVAVEHGYEILVSSTDDDPKRMTHCIRRMLERQVDGVAVMTFGIEEPLLDRGRHEVGEEDREPDLLRRPFGVLVQLNRPDLHGILEGVQHLVALGHKDIAFISGPAQLHSAQSRQRAFVACLRKCGITPNLKWIVEGNHTLEGGISAMEGLLASKKKSPTAVMCSNDMTAIGVLHKLYRAGLRVPHDFSVVGFDNIHIAEVTIPPLTTIEMSRLDLARAAVRALREQLEGIDHYDGQHEFRILTNLVVRESTSVPHRRTLQR